MLTNHARNRVGVTTLSSLILLFASQPVLAAITVTGDVLPVDPGVVTPGSKISIGGNSVGSLTIDQGSALISKDADIGVVNGSQGTVTVAASLDGKLVLTPAIGYVPTIGDSFTLLTAASISGNFDQFSGFSIGDTDIGLTYNAGSVVATVGLTGDLNSDGFVGIDDLNIVLVNWNDSVTPGVWSSGDPTGEGFVGVDDLNVVLGNWNAGTPPPLAAISVPEPASLSILSIISLSLVRRRQDRRDRAMAVRKHQSVLENTPMQSRRGQPMIKQTFIAALMLPASFATATLTPNITVDDTSVPGVTINILTVDTDIDWASAVIFAELSTGTLFNPNGLAPGFETFENAPGSGDTYVTANGSFSNIAGGAGDLGHVNPLSQGAAEFGSTVLGVSWFGPGTSKSDIGSGLLIGQFSFSDDATGTWSLGLGDSDYTTPIYEFSGTIVDGTLLIQSSSQFNGMTFIEVFDFQRKQYMISLGIKFDSEGNRLPSKATPMTLETSDPSISTATLPEPGALAVFGVGLGLCLSGRKRIAG